MATTPVTDEKGANRLARTIASDISIYNAEKVEQGLKNDTLFVVLKDEIAEGLQHYNERVTPELQQTTNFFYRALNDVLLRAKAHIPCKLW